MGSRRLAGRIDRNVRLILFRMKIKHVRSYTQKHRRALLGGLLTILLIGSAVFGIRTYNENVREAVLAEVGERQTLAADILAVTENDHVYGAQDASMHLIMYSDADCQYCRSLYPKLKRVVDSYPVGTVSLAYRYLPLYYTRGIIDDTERAGMCVARDEGDEGFFAFHDALFAALPEGVETSEIEQEILIKSAAAAGITEDVLIECIGSGYGEDRIVDQHRSGGAFGIVGIPYTFLLSELGAYPLPRDLDEQVYRSSVNYVLSERINAPSTQ